MKAAIFLVKLVSFGYNHFLEFYVFLPFNRFGTLFNRFAYRDQCSRQLSNCTEIGGMISHFSECTSTIVKNEFLVVDSFLPCKLYQFCSMHQDHLKFWILAPPLDSYPLLESLWSERGYAFFFEVKRGYAHMLICILRRWLPTSTNNNKTGLQMPYGGRARARGTAPSSPVRWLDLLVNLREFVWFMGFLYKFLEL